MKPSKLTKNGKLIWRVYLGTIDGAKKYKQFKSRDKATDWIRTEEAVTRSHGATVAALQTNEVATWAELDSKLIALGSSLANEARAAIKRISASRKQGSLEDAKEAFLTEQCADLEFRTREDYEKRIRRFLLDRDIENLPARELTKDQLDAHLSSITAKTARQCQYRVLRAWTNWGARSEWWVDGLMPYLKTPKQNKGEATILTPSQARRLLDAAHNSGDTHVLAYIAISLFSGVRPEEFTKISDEGRQFLNWSHVTTCLEIPTKLAKKKIGRTIPLIEPLPAWIAVIRKMSGGILSGSILPAKGWEGRWKNWRDKHWPFKWEQDVLRHSFCTYRLVSTQDPPRVSLEAGNSVGILMQNYWNYKTKNDSSEAFWKMYPGEGVQEKEINKLTKVEG